VIWDDERTLILSNEQRELFTLDLVDIGEISPVLSNKTE